MPALPRSHPVRPALLAMAGLLTLGPLLLASAAHAQPGVPAPGVPAPGVPAPGTFGSQGAPGELPPRYDDRQLDNLLGPVALYPDALLAQLLVAATFPDQVEEAARHVRASGTAQLDDQWWDVSVKAVAHYPSALNMLADRIDWTTALGVAYANQSADVMAAVQRLRRMADQQGNLVSTPQQQVVVERGSYVITPAQPRVIYVPVYDPVVVYTRPVFQAAVGNRFWSFGVGFPIGAWLSYDCDWGARRVYYHGWNSAWIGWGGGWRVRSRPFIQVTNVYMAPRYRDVVVNVHVHRRFIDYRNVDRWRGPHRDTWFAPQFGGRGRDDVRGRDAFRGRDRDDLRGRDWETDRERLPEARRREPVVAAAPRVEPGYATPDGYRRAVPRTDPVEEPRRREPPGDRRRDAWPAPPRMEAPPPPMSIAPPAQREAPRRERPTPPPGASGGERRDTWRAPAREERRDAPAPPERRTARPRTAEDRPPG